METIIWWILWLIRHSSRTFVLESTVPLLNLSFVYYHSVCLLEVLTLWLVSVFVPNSNNPSSAGFFRVQDEFVLLILTILYRFVSLIIMLSIEIFGLIVGHIACLNKHHFSNRASQHKEQGTLDSLLGFPLFCVCLCACVCFCEFMCMIPDLSWLRANMLGHRNQMQ